jgi:hypothetical protein
VNKKVSQINWQGMKLTRSAHFFIHFPSKKREAEGWRLVLFISSEYQLDFYNCMFVFITWSSALRLGVRIVLEICTRGVGPKVYLGTAEALECCLAVSDRLWHAVDSLRFENIIFKNHYRLLPIFGRSETEISFLQLVAHKK